MSTADSQLLLASAVATEDLPWVRRIAANATADAKVRWGRLLLVVMGSIGGAVAVWYPQSVLDLVTYAWAERVRRSGRSRSWPCAGAGSTVAGPWHRWRQAPLVVSVWWFLDGGPSGMWDIHPATPGFPISMSVAVLVAAMTLKPADEVVALFDRVNSDGREE